MDSKEIGETVKRCDPKIFELYRTTHFKGYRKMRDGSVHAVTVEILEDETADAPVRYHVSVKDEETGVRASGNGGPDLATALSVLHWWDLDPIKE